MFGSGFQGWKLHTVSDYMMFFGYILAGILIFWLVIRYMNRQRNHEKAIEKVCKRLERLAKRPKLLLEKPILHFTDGTAEPDALFMDKSGIWLVRAYGWGTKIYGAPDGETWRREDPQRKESFPNPLPELKALGKKLQASLAQKGIEGVKIRPLVVFADNYQTPELYIGYGSCSTTIQELRLWYKKQEAERKADWNFDGAKEAVLGLLEECAAPDPTEPKPES